MLVSTSCTLAHFARDQEVGFETIYCNHKDLPSTVVYVDSQGWHTGLVFHRKDIATALGKFLSDGSSPWLEIGWGDKDFYMSSGYSLWRGVAAILWTSESVLHVAGISPNPERFFHSSQLFRIIIAEEKLPEVLAYVFTFFAQDNFGRSIPLGEGLYGEESAFYQSIGSFSLHNTCNSWTAKALIAAGCLIRSDITRASTLIRELRAQSK